MIASSNSSGVLSAGKEKRPQKEGGNADAVKYEPGINGYIERIGELPIETRGDVEKRECQKQPRSRVGQEMELSPL